MDIRERDDEARGILNPKEFAKFVTLRRVLPGAALEEYVEHYWHVEWALPPGRRYVSEVLPHPSIHLVVEPDRAYVQGIDTSRFRHTSIGASFAFSAKCRPGAAFPILGAPAADFTDTRVDFATIYGSAGVQFADDVRSADSLEDRVALFEGFLAERLRAVPKKVAASCSRVREIIRYIEDTPALTKVKLLEQATVYPQLTISSGDVPHLRRDRAEMGDSSIPHASGGRLAERVGSQQPRRSRPKRPRRPRA